MAKPKRPANKSAAGAVKKSGTARSSARSTVSSPSAKSAPIDTNDIAARKMAATGELAAAMPANPNKAGEYGDAARSPGVGAHHAPRDP